MSQRDDGDGDGCLLPMLILMLCIGGCIDSCQIRSVRNELKSLRLAVEQYGIVAGNSNGNL